MGSDLVTPRQSRCPHHLSSFRTHLRLGTRSLSWLRATVPLVGNLVIHVYVVEARDLSFRPIPGCNVNRRVHGEAVDMSDMSLCLRTSKVTLRPLVEKQDPTINSRTEALIYCCASDELDLCRKIVTDLDLPPTWSHQQVLAAAKQLLAGITAYQHDTTKTMRTSLLSWRHYPSGSILARARTVNTTRNFWAALFNSGAASCGVCCEFCGLKCLVVIVDPMQHKP